MDYRSIIFSKNRMINAKNILKTFFLVRKLSSAVHHTINMHSFYHFFSL